MTTSILTTAAAYLLLSVSLIGCDSGGDDESGAIDEPSSVTEQVTWQVGPTTYTVSSEGADRGAIIASYNPNTVTPSGEGFILSLTALKTDGTTGLVIGGVVDGEGTYTYPDDGAGYHSVTTPAGVRYRAMGLTLTISNVSDASVRGTFSFDAVNESDSDDQVRVENGSFTIEP